jgi:hypothetical protein
VRVFVLLEELAIDSHLPENLLFVRKVALSINSEVGLEWEVVWSSLGHDGCVMPMRIELVKAGMSGKLQVTQNLLVQVWFCDRVKRRKIVVKSGLLGLVGRAAREIL